MSPDKKATLWRFIGIISRLTPSLMSDMYCKQDCFGCDVTIVNISITALIKDNKALNCKLLIQEGKVE